MNVSSWSIKNPIPAVMLFVMLTFAGMLSFNSMKVQQFPDLELPNIIISASLPGAAPAQLETEVARKIENELQYPGQIRVTIVRETRCVEFAK